METLFDYVAERDKAMSQVAENAGESFRSRAHDFVINYLRTQGDTPGEELCDACFAAGITAHDARAMGPVLMKLKRDGIIEWAGYTIRNKGHGTGGGNIWKLKI